MQHWTHTEFTPLAVSWRQLGVQMVVWEVSEHVTPEHAPWALWQAVLSQGLLLVLHSRDEQLWRRAIEDRRWSEWVPVVARHVPWAEARVSAHEVLWCSAEPAAVRQARERQHLGLWLAPLTESHQFWL